MREVNKLLGDGNPWRIPSRLSSPTSRPMRTDHGGCGQFCRARPDGESVRSNDWAHLAPFRRYPPLPVPQRMVAFAVPGKSYATTPEATVLTTTSRSASASMLPRVGAGNAPFQFPETARGRLIS